MSKIHLLLAVCLLSFSSYLLANSDRLLLTGGVSSIEGSAGGGLTPWAFIGGYGTKDQIGANAYYTNVGISEYKVESYGALIGIKDRVELSVARMTLDTKKVGGALGIGNGFQIKQNILGLKVRVLGDGVLEQASWLPQISVGMLHKKNQNGDLVKSLGAKEDSGIDYYVSATKIFLNQSILINTTLRRTKANQLGLLGFGGDKRNEQQFKLEGSLAYLLSRELALGVEYRMKPNNLKVAEEENWSDIFLAWAPSKNISLTLAYAQLGRIAIQDNQFGVYSSLQVGF